MRQEYEQLVELFRQATANVGYTGETGWIAVGLHDIAEAVEKIRNEILPALASTAGVDEHAFAEHLLHLQSEFEHIAEHCSYAAPELDAMTTQFSTDEE